MSTSDLRPDVTERLRRLMVTQGEAYDALAPIITHIDALPVGDERDRLMSAVHIAAGKHGRARNQALLLLRVLEVREAVR